MMHTLSSSFDGNTKQEPNTLFAIGSTAKRNGSDDDNDIFYLILLVIVYLLYQVIYLLLITKILTVDYCKNFKRRGKKAGGVVENPVDIYRGLSNNNRGSYSGWSFQRFMKSL
jgi:hypothetical protein